jgi:hypothetical protein
MADIVFVTNHDDWDGLYVDGALIWEGHPNKRETLTRTVAAASGKKTTLRFGSLEKADWLYEHGSLPQTLAEVIELERAAGREFALEA